MSGDQHNSGPWVTDRIKPTYISFEYKIHENGVCNLVLNRKKTSNSQNADFYLDIQHFFKYVNFENTVRVIVLTSSAKHFTSGIDMDLILEISSYEDKDNARQAQDFEQRLKFLQKPLETMEKCRYPVLVGIDGYCIGAGIDMVSGCDTVYCTKKSKFSIREVELAIIADLGTLQRLPLMTKNFGLLKEQTFTGEFFGFEEANQLGFVSKCFDTRENMEKALNELAVKIAEKSPVTIVGIKKTIDNIKRESIKRGLEYVKNLNMSQIFTEDSKSAVQGMLTKKKVKFPKL